MYYNVSTLVSAGMYFIASALLESAILHFASITFLDTWFLLENIYIFPESLNLKPT